MHALTPEQVADLIETATIEHTTDHGHAVVHVGVTEAGQGFVLVNDCFGESVVSYSL